MTDFSDQVREIEVRLAKAGVPIDAFCRQVGINRSTWTRWKAEATWPRRSVWQRVQAAADELTERAA